MQADVSALAASFDGWVTTTLSVVAIALTVLGVALAVFGVTLGLIALWGYKGLKDWATERAQAAANERLNEVLDSDRIAEQIRSRVATASTEVLVDLITSQVAYSRKRADTSQTEDLSQRVGSMYPEDKGGDDASVEGS